MEVHTCSYRSTREHSFAAVIADEVAFWRSDESANPDVEVLAALRPGLATIPGALLVAISSPYGRRGALWGAYRAHHGHDHNPVLVWSAPTRTMNPSVPEAVIAEALAADPAAAAAEYLAEFRADLEAYVTREALDTVTDPGVTERPAGAGTTYAAFVDPSGGSSDAMTLAIAHAEADQAVLDAAVVIPAPFSPEDAVARLAETCRAYRVTRIVGDRYGGAWPAEAFARHGVTYEPATAPKSDLYAELLPLANSKRVRLLDHPRLRHELLLLERRTLRSGRDTIDHPPRAHDDVANAVAGVLVGVAARCRTTGTIEAIGLADHTYRPVDWPSLRTPG